MAHDEAIGHGSADDEYLPAPGSAYEHTDAHTWTIAKFCVWLAVSAVLIHLGLGAMYQLLISQSERQQAAVVRYPLVSGQGPRLPPVPRLQQFPANDIYQFRQAERELLTTYGWQNREAGTVRIPIAEAMRLTVERGLPARAEDPAAAMDPAVMPADSSSGRTWEQRRQE